MKWKDYWAMLSGGCDTIIQVPLERKALKADQEFGRVGWGPLRLGFGVILHCRIRCRGEGARIDPEFQFTVVHNSQLFGETVQVHLLC